MSRIKINDLSGDINISRQDMKRVFGGGQDVFAGGMEITPKSSGGTSIIRVIIEWWRFIKNLNKQAGLKRSFKK